MIYNLLFARGYLMMLWDTDQIDALAGSDDIDRRIDFNGAPIRQKEFFREPLKVSFAPEFPGDKGLIVPDLCVSAGRLYLNEKAYGVLHDLIQEDGEFLDLIDDRGEPGYLFNPLRVAEKVDALDTKLSRKNEWGDVENIAFHEEKTKDWQVFRCEFNGYMRLYCQEPVKEAIEKAGLIGLYITTDLATPYPASSATPANLN